MNYTINKMKEPLVFFENKKKISFNGYAFLDELGNCFIIVYGEGRRDSIINYLSEYQYVDILS